MSLTNEMAKRAQAKREADQAEAIEQRQQAMRTLGEIVARLNDPQPGDADKIEAAMAVVNRNLNPRDREYVTAAKLQRSYEWRREAMKHRAALEEHTKQRAALRQRMAKMGSVDPDRWRVHDAIIREGQRIDEINQELRRLQTDYPLAFIVPIDAAAKA